MKNIKTTKMLRKSVRVDEESPFSLLGDGVGGSSEEEDRDEKGDGTGDGIGEGTGPQLPGILSSRARVLRESQSY